MKRLLDFQKELLTSLYHSQEACLGAAFAYADPLFALYLGGKDEVPFLDRDHDVVVLSNPVATYAHRLCLREVRQPEESMASVAGHGLILAWKIARERRDAKAPGRVYVLIDDDDLQKGELWEAAMNVAYDRLDQVTAICVYAGNAKVTPVQDKFEAFGWKVIPIVDGHDHDELLDACFKAQSIQRRPTLVLAPITLCKGIPFAEGRQLYRSGRFSEREYDEALKLLKNP